MGEEMEPSRGREGREARRIWADFEFCGVRVQLTEPELTYRDEGDKVICTLQYFGRTMARSAPASSQGSNPLPNSTPTPGEEA